MSHTHNKKKSKNNNKNTNPDTIAPDSSLPTEVKDKIKAFKDIFPKYKSSTNDDILAIFEEFSNDFNAIVYGVSSGLVKTDCTQSWETAGQKKKKKNTGARGKSATPKNRNDYGGRHNANSNRGHSASRVSSSSRGGRQGNPSSRKPNPSNDNKQVPPPRVAQSKPAAPKPSTAAPPRQPTQSSTPQAPISASKPVTERLSYANVAKSREAWNPNNIGKTAAPAAKTPQSTTVKESTTSPSPKVEEAPVSSIPSNVQSKPAPSSQPISTPQTGNPFNNAAKPVQERQPRVGVLLPGNFTSDDSMSFQFGNLGLLEEETTTTAISPSTESEHKTNTTNPSKPAPTQQQATTQRVNAKPDAQQPSDMSKMNAAPAEGEMPMGGMPMSQYPYPMYPVGMEPMDPSGARPMPFYPEQYPTHAYSRGDGKYPRGGSSNYSGAGRDSGTSGAKFNAENGDKTPASQTTQQTTPYAYGPYPVYGHPFVNQFHGGSYGSQFYPGFYKNPPAFPPGYQNFGNTGMGYAQEDEYRKMAGQYYPQEGSMPPNTGAPNSSGKSGQSQTSPPKQQQGQQQQGQQQPQQGQTSSMEGSYPQSPPGFKSQGGAVDYYSPDMYMGSSFATPQPFGYPPMGQQAYPPQPQQPQQGSSQSSSTQNRNY